MNNADTWLQRYERDHTHVVNRVLHWICIPFIVIGLVGLLWALPVPDVFSESSPVLNWGAFFLMAAVVYYFIMSIRLAFGMLPFILGVALIVGWLDGLSTPLWLVSATTFAVAGTGQLIGHTFEGRPVSLFRDLNFVIIGPAWIVASIYQRLGIAY